MITKFLTLMEVSEKPTISFWNYLRYMPKVEHFIGLSTIFIQLILNSFINARANTKSRDRSSDTCIGHASKPYRSCGKHLMFTKYKITSETTRHILPNITIKRFLSITERAFEIAWGSHNYLKIMTWLTITIGNGGRCC